MGELFQKRRYYFVSARGMPLVDAPGEHFFQGVGEVRGPLNVLSLQRWVEDNGKFKPGTVFFHSILELTRADFLASRKG